MQPLFRKTERDRSRVATSVPALEVKARSRIETRLRVPTQGRIWKIGAYNEPRGLESRDVQARIKKVFGTVASARDIGPD